MVNVVLQGLESNMRQRQQTDPALLLTELSLELEHCAKAFAGGLKTEEPVFDDLVEFAATRFGHLGVREIRQAFHLAVAGDLGELNLRAYYGTFTVGMLGEVLRAYDRYRKVLVAEARRQEQAWALEAAEQEKKASWDQEAWELNRVAQLRSQIEPNLDSVSALDFDVLERRGLLVLTAAEKWALFEKAGVQLQAKLQVQASQAAFGEKITLRTILDRVKSGQTDQRFYGMQVGWSKRMAVLQWIERERQRPTDIL